MKSQNTIITLWESAVTILNNQGNSYNNCKLKLDLDKDGHQDIMMLTVSSTVKFKSILSKLNAVKSILINECVSTEEICEVSSLQGLYDAIVSGCQNLWNHGDGHDEMAIGACLLKNRKSFIMSKTECDCLTPEHAMIFSNSSEGKQIYVTLVKSIHWEYNNYFQLISESAKAISSILIGKGLVLEHTVMILEKQHALSTAKVIKFLDA